MKVYHGTSQTFDKFNSNKLGENTIHMSSASTAGFYFTDNIEYAEDYAYNASADGCPKIIMECNIKLDNPCDCTESDISKWSGKDLRNALIEDGHDGAIIYINDEINEYLVLDSDQIEICKVITSSIK